MPDKSNMSHILKSTAKASMILQYGILMDDLLFFLNKVMSCSGFVGTFPCHDWIKQR
uniref:Uncharacterized protein n=1 Tax=Glossina palpalis gambiensis TaxID=67801 RepID=A0A1B0B794_9MUSC